MYAVLSVTIDRKTGEEISRTYTPTDKAPDFVAIAKFFEKRVFEDIDRKMREKLEAEEKETKNKGRHK